MARKKKAEIDKAIEVKGNVVVVSPKGGTVTARQSFTPTVEGTWRVHDGNTGEELAAYNVVDPTPETGAADEGQTDASAPADPAAAENDQAGA